jgi:hypothetical protein
MHLRRHRQAMPLVTSRKQMQIIGCRGNALHGTMKRRGLYVGESVSRYFRSVDTDTISQVHVDSSNAPLFLTCQWKTAKNGGHHHAAVEGATVGAAIVQNLRELYTKTNQSSTLVDTAHFSLTTDIHTGKLWDHWLGAKKSGQPAYYMEVIGQAFVTPLPAETLPLDNMAKMFKNIKTDALGPRLEKIKIAVAAISNSRSIPRSLGREEITATPAITDTLEHSEDEAPGRSLEDAAPARIAQITTTSQR